MNEISQVIAGFTSPMDISTTPSSLLWMFPLLLAVALIYKATKLRIIRWGNFLRQSAVLFLTLSVFISAAAAVLIFLVQFITG